MYPATTDLRQCSRQISACLELGVVSRFLCPVYYSKKLSAFFKNQAKTSTQRNLEHEYASQPTIRREESKAEWRLLLGVTHHWHQGSAILGVSSLTFGGSTNFINLCEHEGEMSLGTSDSLAGKG